MLISILLLALFTVVSLYCAVIVATATALRKSVRVTFCLAISSLLFWVIFLFLSNLETPQALWWNRVVFIAPFFGLLFFGWFIETAFIARKMWSKFRFELGALIAAGAAILALTPLVVKDVVLRVEDGSTTGYSIVPGPLYLLYIGAYLVLLGIVIYQFYVALVLAKKGKNKVKGLRLVLWATVVTTLVSFTTNAVAPALSLSAAALNVVSNITILIFMITITYAILHQGLLDIKLTVARTIAYVLSILVMAMTYFGAAYLLSITIFQGSATTGISSSPINVILALVLALIFQPIKSFFDRVTDKVFYRDRYESSEFYAHLSELLASTTDLGDMLKQAALEIQRSLKVEDVFFVIAEGREKYSTWGTPKHRKLSPADVHDLNVYVERHGEIAVVTKLLDDRHINRLLASYQVDLVIPLVRYGAIIGYLMLGEQRGSGFTKRDLRVLETVSDELIIAIQHAVAVQQVKSINENLEQRIESATAELRTSNARLKRLDASKDEFLSMASHQLRTPLTSIKGYLSMMLEGDVGNVTPMQKKVLVEAFTSSERMVHLIHDFLNVSRLQTGKFMLELQEVDLAKLVSAEVKSLNRAAQSRNMTLKFINKARSVPMTLDDTKVRQVIMNYIDNAIFYSHTDSIITIELTKTEKEAELTVTDTGIGVPANEQDQLFGKFFRATNARKQRPDGTGVGLYLAKKVITAHGGEVVFKSKVSRGSTFGFRLPLDQDLKKLEENTKQFVDQPSE